MKKQTEMNRSRNAESTISNKKQLQESAGKVGLGRHEALRNVLLSKRQEIIEEIQETVCQSLSEEQQRRSESLGDVGDQALMDHERARDISLMDMRTRQKQSLEEALTRLHEGTYGICAECGIDINEKRLQAVPFAKLCAECLTREELLASVDRQETREEF